MRTARGSQIARLINLLLWCCCRYSGRSAFRPRMVIFCMVPDPSTKRAVPVTSGTSRMSENSVTVGLAKSF